MLADVGLHKGLVAAVLAPGTSVNTREESDVKGKFLLRGLVDAHVHFREPGLPHKEDFSTGSHAAIAGGVTTALVMPTDNPWTFTSKQFRQKAELAHQHIKYDIGLQIDMSRESNRLAELVELGAVSFEIFTADTPHEFKFTRTDDILGVFRRITKVGGICGVSPQDAGATPCGTLHDLSIQGFLSQYPPQGEALGVARNIVLAAAASARIHIRQISGRGAVDVLARLKDYADVTIEVPTQNLHFTKDDYERLGVWAKASPPFREREDVDALRDAISSGLVDMVITDHAPHSYEEKIDAANFPSVPGGMPGVQTLLPSMLSLVNQGLIDLPAAVRLCSEAPASRFGLTGKGRIAVGRDADIVVLDPFRGMQVKTKTNFPKRPIHYSTVCKFPTL